FTIAIELAVNRAVQVRNPLAGEIGPDAHAATCRGQIIVIIAEAERLDVIDLRPHVADPGIGVEDDVATDRETVPNRTIYTRRTHVRREAVERAVVEFHTVAVVLHERFGVQAGGRKSVV